MVKFCAFFGVVVIFSVGNAVAESSAGMEQEYAQVRKIALKDPHVLDAYRKADQKLDDRMIEIDPSLKPMIERHEAQPNTAPALSQAPVVKRETVHVAKTPFYGRHHVVAQGETLGSIAARYKVKVADIESTNHITDARKLRVGQNLLIPSASASAPSGVNEEAPAAPAPSATPQPSASTDSNGGLLDKLKNL